MRTLITKLIGGEWWSILTLTGFVYLALCQGVCGMEYALTNKQAQYLVDYINEELTRGEKITVETIEHALDAYEGGAADQ